MSWSPKLIIFVKAPKIGQAKTRLAKDIGAARAATFYRHATAKLLGRMADHRWETLLAVDPAPFVSGGFDNVWPLHFQRIGQGQGDLGQRMSQQFCHAKPGPVIIIGSDAPGVTRTLIAQGFARLRRSDAVFGPAEDGGYWLIGLARRRFAPHLFEHVRWSTAQTMQDTLATLPRHFQVSYLPIMADVDQGDDLARQKGALLRSFLLPHEPKALRPGGE